MAKNTKSKKPQQKTAADRSRRRQQIIIYVFSFVLIISMVASMLLSL